MFNFFKRLKQKRIKNKELSVRRAAALKKVIDFGYEVNHGEGHICYLCRDSLYEVHTTKIVTSHSGEQFKRWGEVIGFVCPRCTTVSRNYDASNGIPLCDWDGKPLPRRGPWLGK